MFVPKSPPSILTGYLLISMIGPFAHMDKMVGFLVRREGIYGLMGMGCASKLSYDLIGRGRRISMVESV